MLIYAHKKKNVMTVSSTTSQSKSSMLESEMSHECQHIMRNAIKLSEEKKVIYIKNSD